MLGTGVDVGTGYRCRGGVGVRRGDRCWEGV